MSRLAHSELHLTFRDWSSSESEDENYMEDSTTNVNNNTFEAEEEQEATRERSTDGTQVRGRQRATSLDMDVGNILGDDSYNEDEVASENGRDSFNHSNVTDLANGRDRNSNNESGGNLFPLISLPTPLIYNRTGMLDNIAIPETFSPVMQDDENSNSSTPPHLLNGTINIEDIHSTDWIPRILSREYNLRQNAFSGSSFFKYHPEHEFCHGIPMSMQKYGLINMLNDLLLARNDYLLSTEFKNGSQIDDRNKKRTFNQLCLEDMNLAFLLDQPHSSKMQQLASTSFLKSGSYYSLSVPLNGLSLSIRFTEVDYEGLHTTGYFQLGDVRLGFTGELVDFIKSDLRYTKDRKFLVEGNVFSNLLRNKLIFSKKFNKCFDKKRKKCYTKENWKPFSMNRMGYIVSNKTNNQNVNADRTIINPVKPSKFPNGSIFHKLQVTSESKFDNFKLLSKWFEMPPLNQFINTPSPPTPPSRQKKCTNNPENLLVCKDCVNLMISKFLFLKLEVDIQDLFENSSDSSNQGLIYPDLIFKHRRRFHDYANRLMSKSNSNFRRHLERQMRGMTHNSNSLFGGSRMRSSLNSLQSSDDDDSDEEHVHNTQFTSQSSNREMANLASAERQNNPSMEFNSVSDEEFDEDFIQEDSIDYPEGHNSEVMESDSDEYYNDITDNANSSDGENGNISDDARSNSNYDEGPDNSGMLAVWPLSAERFSESHPILDPDISSNEGEFTDEEIDHPYNIIFTNDRSRRVSRLLFNINMAREQHRHKREPVSSLSLYKNGNARMKTIFLACINRNTGELHILPGNLDLNMWSNEQNNGELFEDIETFSKVFKLFMANNSPKSERESNYSKRMRRWIRNHCKTESEEVKKLMMLQMLVNPSIISGLEKRRAVQKRKIDKRKKRRQLNRGKLDDEKKSKQQGLKKKKGKCNEKVVNATKSKYEAFLADSGASADNFNDDIKEQLYNFMGESNAFDIDNDKALTLHSGVDNGNSKQKHGLLFSFEYA